LALSSTAEKKLSAYTPQSSTEPLLTMIRFLRQNAEILTAVCVLASLLIGGSLLYVKIQSDEAGQAELDALVVSEPAKHQVAVPTAAPTPTMTATKP